MPSRKRVAGDVQAIRAQVLVDSIANETGQGIGWLEDLERLAAACALCGDTPASSCDACWKLQLALDHFREALRDSVLLGARVPDDVREAIVGHEVVA